MTWRRRRERERVGEMAAAFPAAPPAGGGGDILTGVGSLGGPITAQEWRAPATWRRQREIVGEMAAAIPAAPPAWGDDRTGVGTLGGPISAQDWSEIKAKSSKILRRSVDQKRLQERMKRRAKELLSGRPGEIKLDLAGEDLVCTSFGKDPTLLEDFRKVNKEDLLSDMGEGTLSTLTSCNLERNNHILDSRDSDSWTNVKGGEENQGADGLCRIRGKVEISTNLFWKLPNQEHFLCVKCINFTPFDTFARGRGTYFKSRGACLCSVTQISATKFFPTPLCQPSGVSLMASGSDLERRGEEGKERGEASGGVLASAAALGAPATTIGEGELQPLFWPLLQKTRGRGRRGVPAVMVRLWSSTWRPRGRRSVASW